MTIIIGNIPFRRPAHEALLQLSAADQAQVRDALAALSGVPWRAWPRERLRKLPDRSAYLFTIGPELRLFLQPPADEDEMPVVMDMARKDTLAAFAVP